MVISRFTRAILPATLLALGLASLSHAEEKSLWQKFKDFFSPMPTVEGEGPEYDKLREMDKRINTLEGKYSRERRPNNKANIKKELDTLKAERAALEEQIRKNPPEPSSPAATNSSAAAQSANSNAAAPQGAAPTCKTDTVFVRDTVIVHDTLYVIVADKKAEGSAPATPAVTPSSQNSATSAETQEVSSTSAVATPDSASVQPGTK